MRAEEVRRTGHRAGVLAVGSLLLAAASLLAWLICTIAAWLSSGSDLYRPSRTHSRFTGWADAASNWATVLFVAGIALYIVRIVARHVGSHLAETEAAHAEELRDRDRRIQRRQELDRRLDDRVSSALTAFERLPTHLRDAEAALDRAGIDYDDNAYAPFWDEIETATRALAEFGNDVDRIRRLAADYQELSREREDLVAPFPFGSHSFRALPVYTHLTERLTTSVRTAQRNFHYATIFEQRKTNRLLVAGFHSLASAIDTMSTQLDRRLTDLDTTIQTMSESLRTELSGIQHTATATGLERTSADRELLRRHDTVVSMLDNIQRGHRPLL